MKCLLLLALLFLVLVSADAMEEEEEMADFPIGSLNGHLTLGELEQWTALQLERFPALCKQFAIGRTVQNRTLYAFCLGAACLRATPTNLRQSTANFETLYTALHHAREPLGMMSLVAFVHDILQKYTNGDVSVQHLVKTTRLYFVFVVNPDGYYANEHSVEKMRRKNLGEYCTRNPVSADAQEESGVDLNRNYEVCFDRDKLGASRDPCEIDYQGPFAFSEPETVAMRDFVLQRDFAVAFNYHSFGKQIYLPFSCQPLGATKDDAFFLKFAQRLSASNGYSYGQPWNSGLYSVNGDASDWMYSAKGIFAVSPEVAPADPVRSERDGFWVDERSVHELARETLEMNYIGAWTAGVYYELERAGSNGRELRLFNFGVKRGGAQKQQKQRVQIAVVRNDITLVSWLREDLLPKGESSAPVPFGSVIAVRDGDGNCAVFDVSEEDSNITVRYRLSSEDAPCAELFETAVVVGAGADPMIWLYILLVLLLLLAMAAAWVVGQRWRRRANEDALGKFHPVATQEREEEEGGGGIEMQ